MTRRIHTTKFQFPGMSDERYQLLRRQLAAADKAGLAQAKAERFRATAGRILPGWERS